MSLEDRLEPNDGSFIDILDSGLCKFNQYLGDKWQSVTGKSVMSLRKGLCGLSALGMLTNSLLEIVTSNVGVGTYTNMLPMLGMSYKSINPDICLIKNKFEARKMEERYQLPSKSFVSLNAILYFSSFVIVSNSLTWLGLDLLNGYGQDLFHSHSTLFQGLGLFSWFTSDYMGRSDYDEPPKRKSLLEKAKEKLYGLLHMPEIKPIKIEINS